MMPQGIVNVFGQSKHRQRHGISWALLSGQSIHHTTLSIGTDAEIKPVFGNSVRVTMYDGFHTVTVFMDSNVLERIFQAWPVFNPIPY